MDQALLQPCAVCQTQTRTVVGQTFVCNACTAFFRRSVGLERTFICLRSDNCDIAKGLRNSCRACRLRKCVDVGLFMEGTNLYVQPRSRTLSVCSADSPRTVELRPASPGSFDLVNMFYSLPTLKKKLGFFRTFQQRQQSLFHVQNPQRIFQNKSRQLCTINIDEYQRMEHGTLQMVSMMASDCLDLCSSFDKSKKVDVIKSSALQISLLHKGFLTAQMFPDLDDRRLVTHYGYFVDLDKNTNDKDLEAVADQEEKFIRSGYEAMFICSQKFRRFNLSEIEAAFLAAVICLEEIENHGLLSEEWERFRETLYTEMHSYILSAYGVQIGPGRLIKLVSLMQNVAHLYHAYNDMLTLVNVFLEDAKDMRHIETSFLDRTVLPATDIT